MKVESAEESGSKLGKSAGFIFYETYEGFYFRGIDSLFGQKPKIKIIFNNTPGNKIPEGYDAKALSYTKEGTMSLTKKLRSGYMNTKNIMKKQNSPSLILAESPFSLGK